MRNKIRFNDEHEFYEVLGLLAKSDRSLKIRTIIPTQYLPDFERGLNL